MKIGPIGAELFLSDRRTEDRTEWRADGQMDMKLIVAFRVCTNAPKTAGPERNVLSSSLVPP
jgi:hypothetical protein